MRVFLGCAAFALLMLHSPVIRAEELFANDVSGFEQHLFGQSFSSDTMENRLSRLESVLFGTPQPGIAAVREQHIAQVMKPLMQQAQTPAPAPAGNTNYQPFSQPAPQPAAEPQEPDATSYPTVTALERQIIGRDFISQDITTRLDRLEQRVFGHNFPNLALSDRVDRLLSENPGVRNSINPAPEPAPTTRSALDGLPSNSSQFVGSGRDTYTKLELLENNLFGHPNAGRLITERLDLLEEKAYGYTYGGEAVDTRLNRLLANYQNRYAQQAGQPAQNQNPSFTSQQQSGTGQNIQIGAGIAGNSQFSSFSPELLNMLPPDQRAQVFQQRQQAQQPQIITQQMTGGPFGGTTTSTTTYSGFNNFGGPPIQYRSTTTMEAAPGTTIQQQYSTYPAYPSSDSLIYTGNPAVVQALNDLETRVYGTPDTTNSVPIRLAKLEVKLSGQTYVNYPDEARVDNLNKIYQYQSLGKVFGNGTTGTVLRGVGGAMLGIPLNSPPATTPTTAIPSTNK